MSFAAGNSELIWEVNKAENCFMGKKFSREKYSFQKEDIQHEDLQHFLHFNAVF